MIRQKMNPNIIYNLKDRQYPSVLISECFAMIGKNILFPLSIKSQNWNIGCFESSLQNIYESYRYLLLFSKKQD